MNELKKGLGADISQFVEFVEGTHETDFEYLADDGNYDNNTSLTTELSQAIYPASGDAIYLKEDSRDGYGTLGILTVKDDHSMEHCAVTCYHVCYNGDIPFQEDRDSYEWHQILCDDSKNDGSLTRQTKYLYRHREGEIKNELGQFSWGKKDEFHDIAFIDVAQNLKCMSTVNDISDKVATRKEIGQKMRGGKLIVEKSGFSTKETKGILSGIISGYPSESRPILRECYQVEDETPDKPFADRGDSGSLVKLVVGEEKIPFAYLVAREGGEHNSQQKRKKKNFCFSLDDSLNEYTEKGEQSVKPCLKSCSVRK